MPRLLRTIDLGNNSFRLWIEDNGTQATFTIDSEPYKRINLREGNIEEKAIIEFREWIKVRGIDPSLCRGTPRMVEIENLRAQFDRGEINDIKYWDEEAKIIIKYKNR